MEIPESLGPLKPEPKTSYTACFIFDDLRVVEARERGGNALRHRFKTMRRSQKWAMICMWSCSDEEGALVDFSFAAEGLDSATSAEIVINRAVLHLSDWLRERNIEDPALVYAGVSNDSLDTEGELYIEEFTTAMDGVIKALRGGEDLHIEDFA